MSSDEIRYSIDNQEKIFEELKKKYENLSQDVLERIKNLLENGNVDEVYNVLSNASTNVGVTLNTFKLLYFLQSPEEKDKLFSDEEYKNILKGIVDIYGDKLSDIFDIDSRSFDINDFNFLLSLDDPKYFEIYSSILKRKLVSFYSKDDVLNLLKSVDSRVITKDLIINYLDNRKSFLYGKDFNVILNLLPNSILQDGTIAKKIIDKFDYISKDVLKHIPASFYTPEFIKEIIGKFKYDFDTIFEYIPSEFKTREIWEEACNRDLNYLQQLPKENIDKGISQEEYDSWAKSLVVSTIEKNPENAIYILSILTDDKKDINVCQKAAEAIVAMDYVSYPEFLKHIPESSRTLKLYETLASKSYYILTEIPSETFIPTISQEEYDTWYENLISQTISNAKDMSQLYSYLPYSKFNERLWNEFLDKCIEKNVDRGHASLALLDFRNITPKMVERALKDIHPTEICNIPCIDQKLDDLPHDLKEKYAKWQESLSESQKQEYRTWYEKLWIDFVKNTGWIGNLYSNVPKEAITTAMNKACIDINNDLSLKLMPTPETPKQLQEYQQLLIYALDKYPEIEYIGDSTYKYEHLDLLRTIPREYLSDDVIRHAVGKNLRYLDYANPKSENFSELLDIAFKNKLASMNRTELTQRERELMQKFAINNAELFKTFQLEILDPKIVSAIGESSLEKIVRHGDVEWLVLDLAENENVLKTFGFALDNLKMDDAFIEPLIEKLGKSISLCKQDTWFYSSQQQYAKFFDIVSERLDKKDMPFTDYEKTVISYLTLNSGKAKKIKSYDDILTFVERRNVELENIINDENSTFVEIKNAYLERVTGLNYGTVVNLVTMYGNDPEQILQNYKNVSPESYKELGEKEALEAIIKLRSLIETQDIDAIKTEFKKYTSLEKKEDSFLRYQKSTVLENALRRAYGRDMVDSLSKNVDLLQTQELDFNGEKYTVRKVSGDFNRMVSLLGAYRKASTTEGDMYDRWNTNQMANNHALCFSFINQSNPGTAMIDDKKGIIVSINGFSPESISAAAPYDLCSDNRKNTVFTGRQQRFFSSKDMPNQIRGLYSEYDIEIQDILAKDGQYKKIQPSSIICFEEVDEDSIKAAIELGKKLGYPVPIELIDRRELAKNEMIHIMDALNKFKTSEEVDTSLVEEIVTRFCNVRNAHRFSSLSNELLGTLAENQADFIVDALEDLKGDEEIDKSSEEQTKSNVSQEENKKRLAPFNIVRLNQILTECISNVEHRIRNGQTQEGLEALEKIKEIVSEERKKSFLMPTMYEKQLWTGIDVDIDHKIDELQRTYGKQEIKSFKGSKTLDVLSQMQGQDLSSITFDVSYGKRTDLPEQLTAKQIISMVDVSKIEESIEEIHSEGYYQGNKDYDEEHVSRVILFSDAISKMDGYDDKTRALLAEAAKYYSCGRKLDVSEDHGQYSAKLAGNRLSTKYSQSDINIIQAAIELQDLKSDNKTVSEVENDRKAKLHELCSLYGISGEQSEVVSKIASCIRDAVVLDRIRFVDKAKNTVPESSFTLGTYTFNSDSAKKLVKFSYSLQDQLAQKELDKYSRVIHMNFDDEKNKIIKEFFTRLVRINEVKTKDDSIVASPVVRLEYLKTIHPELANIDLDELISKMQTEVVASKSDDSIDSSLEPKHDSRLQKFRTITSNKDMEPVPIINVDELQANEIIQNQDAQIDDIQDSIHI